MKALIIYHFLVNVAFDYQKDQSHKPLELTQSGFFYNDLIKLLLGIKSRLDVSYSYGPLNVF